MTASSRSTSAQRRANSSPCRIPVFSATRQSVRTGSLRRCSNSRGSSSFSKYAASFRSGRGLCAGGSSRTGFESAYRYETAACRHAPSPTAARPVEEERSGVQLARSQRALVVGGASPSTATVERVHYLVVVYTVL